MTLSRPFSPLMSDDQAVAVLIDGENIAVTHAERILTRAGQQGELRIRRVYGNAAILPGWDAQPGVDLVHTHSGKNSADLRLVIDAVDLAVRGQAQRFVIVSSDGDFTHLARYLREHGHKVTGMGGQKTPETFQRACAWFVFLKDPEKPKPVRSTLETRVCEVIRKRGQNDEIKIALLGARMKADEDMTLSHLEETGWRAFLTARPHLFDCDPKGPDACVRLIRAARA